MNISIRRNMFKILFFLSISINFSISLIASNVYYVSPKGNDANPGTINRPWRSIQKAANLMVAGDTCIIRGGIYREWVKAVNSGTSNGMITYKAYPSEDVIISGTEIITPNWMLHVGNIYKANVDMTLKSQNQLFVNGEMMFLARWPNSKDFFEPAFSKAQKGSDATHIVDERMPNIDLTGATVYVWEKWLTWSSTVTESLKNTITMKDHAPDNPTRCSPNSQFYLLNKLELLDTAREWYFDSANRMLYLWQPNGGNPSNSQIEIKKRMGAFNLDQKSFIKIEGINIFGANISLKGADHCIIDGVDGKTMKYISQEIECEKGYNSQSETGIKISGNNNEVRNYEIAYSSGNGIIISGDSNKIVNNYIHDVNFTGTYAGNVSIHGRHNYLGYNTLNNSGRGTLEIGGLKASIIEHNDISGGMKLASDGGLIYTPTTDGENTEIRYNWLHDCQSHLAEGLYLDNSSANYIVHHNAIWNISDSEVKLNQPSNFIFLYDNMIDGDVISDFAWVFQDDTYGNRITDNVITGKSYVHGNMTLISGTTQKGFDKLSYGIPGHNFFKLPVISDFKITLLPFRNLVLNGSFENRSISSWQVFGKSDVGFQHAAGGTIWEDKGLTRTNGGSIRIGNNSGVKQIIKELKPNTTYECGGWAKVGTGDTAVFGVKDFGGAEVSENIGNTENGWVNKKMRFTTGKSDTNATIFFSKSSVSSKDIFGDDFSAVYIGEGVVKGLPDSNVNLTIKNSGFEDGATDQYLNWWTSGNNLQLVKDNVHNGNFCAKSIGSLSGISQLVHDLKPLTTYTLTAYAKCADQNQKGYIFVRKAGGIDPAKSYATSDTWAPLTLTFRTGPSNTTCEVSFWRDEDSGNGDIYIDDFEITEKGK